MGPGWGWRIRTLRLFGWNLLLLLWVVGEVVLLLLRLVVLVVVAVVWHRIVWLCLEG